MEFEARKYIASRYDIAPYAADILDEPIIVVRATGTTVVSQQQSRTIAPAAGPAN